MALLLCRCALRKKLPQLSYAPFQAQITSFASVLTSRSRISCSSLFLTRSDMCAAAVPLHQYAPCFCRGNRINTDAYNSGLSAESELLATRRYAGR
jgi:hypothetical protein